MKKAFMHESLFHIVSRTNQETFGGGCLLLGKLIGGLRRADGLAHDEDALDAPPDKPIDKDCQ